MTEPETKLRELGIKEKDISLYIDILTKSDSFEELKHQGGLHQLGAGAQQFLDSVFVLLYKNNAEYRKRLMVETGEFGISQEEREVYFLHYKSQPSPFHSRNKDMLLEKRLQFIAKADSLVLEVVKEYLGL